MKYLFNFLLICLIFLFVQCDPEEFFTTTIEVEAPEHESKLAVVAHLTTQDSVHRVFISNSVGILDRGFSRQYTDALVELYEDNNLLATFGYNEETRFYELLNIGQLQTGKTYRLEVSHPNHETVSSEQQLTITPKIKEVKFEEDGGISDFGERVDALTIEFEDLDPANNYFELQFRSRQVRIRDITINGNQTVDTFDFYQPLYPFVENGLMQSGTDGRLLFTNDVFNTKNITLRILSYVPDANPSGEFPIEVYLSTITKDRYFYEISLYRNRNSTENPFVEPVILYENIQDGHGIFSLGAMDIWVLE